MTQNAKFSKIDDLADLFKPPAMIVSTKVGRGMFTLGQAIKQRLETRVPVEHVAIEDYVSQEIVREDLEHYKWISNNCPWLLYIAYKTPFVYLRKYLREKYLRSLDVSSLGKKIGESQPGSVICVSHRPAFWVTTLRRREKLAFDTWGVLGEYGTNLGWQYIFWEQMKGYLSPVAREDLAIRIPQNVSVVPFELPARQEFEQLANTAGDRNSVLLVCGFWGQGPFVKIIRTLVEAFPRIKVHAVFAENTSAFEKARQIFDKEERVKLYPTVPSLVPLLEQCAAVITKPGISTLLESHAAKRKLFLLRGMPVAEDNNARFACAHFGAEWFSVEALANWLEDNDRRKSG
jgi:hypothetical protein